MSQITTHVLDTSKGRPAPQVPVRLDRNEGGEFVRVGGGVTDDDGRVRALLGGEPLREGVYRLTFDTDRYFERIGEEGFYPEAIIVFRVRNAGQHHHVPLLLNPFGYSTYRGS